MRLVPLPLAATLVVAATATTSAGQDLRGRIRAAGDGDVSFHFAAREGVCGDGEVIVRQRAAEGRSISFHGDSRDLTRGRDFDDLASWCRPGPVYVRLVQSGAAITHMELTVGANPFPPSRDLGEVTPAEAARVLIQDVARSLPEKSAGRAVHAATLAATPTWELLLPLASDESADRSLRRAAIRWLALDASDVLLQGREAIDTETEFRRQAVFALSRRRDEPSRTALWDLAQRGTEPEIRAVAVYWIGMSDDPRAVGLIEDVLRGR